MKIPHLFKTDIQENIRSEYLNSNEFKEDLIILNSRRGNMLSRFIIAFEAIFISIDILACLRRKNLILATDSAGKSGGETTVSLPCGAPAVTVGLKVRASGALRPKYTGMGHPSSIAVSEPISILP